MGVCVCVSLSLSKGQAYAIMIVDTKWWDQSAMKMEHFPFGCLYLFFGLGVGG
jgi:hypothetical protein